MNQNILIPKSAEIIKNRFYFLPTKPTSLSFKVDAFSIDNELIYDNFNKDFGPLNLGKLYRYCVLVQEKLKNNFKAIIHYSNSGAENLDNAAYLVGSFSIIYLSKSANDAFTILKKPGIHFLPFRDASMMPNRYTISLKDVFDGIEKALKVGFLDFKNFDVQAYDYYEKVENGDMNWIIPGKILAFCGPEANANKTLTTLSKNQKESPDPGTVNANCNHHPPSFFVPHFKANNVDTVVRLNEPDKYDAKDFTSQGIRHHDLYFPDGGCPSEPIVKSFLDICFAHDEKFHQFTPSSQKRPADKSTGAIAVHCKAGLGRTGTLIACYIMAKYKFTALEAISWIRICRPGSVLGHQQNFLEKMQASLWKFPENDATTYKKLISSPPDHSIPPALVSSDHPPAHRHHPHDDTVDPHSRSPHKPIGNFGSHASDVTSSSSAALSRHLTHETHEPNPKTAVVRGKQEDPSCQGKVSPSGQAKNCSETAGSTAAAAGLDAVRTGGYSGRCSSTLVNLSKKLNLFKLNHNFTGPGNGGTVEAEARVAENFRSNACNKSKSLILNSSDGSSTFFKNQRKPRSSRASENTQEFGRELRTLTWPHQSHKHSQGGKHNHNQDDNTKATLDHTFYRGTSNSKKTRVSSHRDGCRKGCGRSRAIHDHAISEAPAPHRPTGATGNAKKSCAKMVSRGDLAGGGGGLLVGGGGGGNSLVRPNGRGHQRYSCYYDLRPTVQRYSSCGANPSATTNYSV